MRTAALLSRRLPTSSLYSRFSWASIRHSRVHQASKSLSTVTGNVSTRSSSQHKRSKWSRFYNNRALYIGSATLALLVVAPLGLPSTVCEKGPQNASPDIPPEKTIEQLMLEESDLEREELQAISKDQHVVFRIANHIKILTVNWLIEPIATGFRFVTLVTIFVPLILAVPLVYLGRRLPEKSNERQGTIWWYAFLIKSMEQAGPTFIKVGISLKPHLCERFL
jgi:hypothetical protein